MWAMVIVLVSATSFATVANQVTVSDQFASLELCRSGAKHFRDVVAINDVTAHITCIQVK